MASNNSHAALIELGQSGIETEIKTINRLLPRIDDTLFDSLKKWWKDRTESEQAWQVDIDTIKANGYNLDIKNPHQPEEEKQYSSAELLDMRHQPFAKGDDLLGQLRKELV